MTVAMSDFDVAVVLGVIGLALTWGAVLAALVWLAWPAVRRWRRERRRGGLVPPEVLSAAGERAEVVDLGSFRESRSRPGGKGEGPLTAGPLDSLSMQEGSCERTDQVGGR